MTKKKILLGCGLGFLVFAVVAALLLKSFLTQPDLSLDDVLIENLDGTKGSLENYVGKPIVVNYWATWCKPCIAEFPYFEKLIKEKGDAVHFVMISDESKEKIVNFSESNPYSFKHMRSLAGLNKYGITARPTTYFYNARGELSSKHMGGINYETLKKMVDEIK